MRGRLTPLSENHPDVVRARATLKAEDAARAAKDAAQPVTGDDIRSKLLLLCNLRAAEVQDLPNITLACLAEERGRKLTNDDWLRVFGQEPGGWNIDVRPKGGNPWQLQ